MFVIILKNFPMIIIIIFSKCCVSMRGTCTTIRGGESLWEQAYQYFSSNEIYP